MSLSSRKIETISTVPDEELCSIDQIDISALGQALSKKPTYKAYKALLVHRHTLRCLKINVDHMVEVADAALCKASENRKKAEQTLVNACNSTVSPNPATSPPISGKALQTIIELQTMYYDEQVSVLVECDFEQGRAQRVLDDVNKRVKKIEQAWVKKFGYHTVDDEGNPVYMQQNVEPVLDVMASIPENEDLRESWAEIPFHSEEFIDVVLAEHLQVIAISWERDVEEGMD